MISRFFIVFLTSAFLFHPNAIAFQCYYKNLEEVLLKNKYSFIAKVDSVEGETKVFLTLMQNFSDQVSPKIIFDYPSVRSKMGGIDSATYYKPGSELLISTNESPEIIGDTYHFKIQQCDFRSTAKSSSKSVKFLNSKKFKDSRAILQ